MSLRLDSYEGAREFVDWAHQMTAENLVQYGYLAPVAFVFITRTPEGERLDPPGFAVVACGSAFDDTGKTAYAEAVAHVARTQDAIGVLLVVEAWMAPDAGPTHVRVMPREHAARKEVLLFSLEHASFRGTRIFMADIARDAAGAPRAGALRESEHADAKGRFTDLLRRESAS